MNKRQTAVTGEGNAPRGFIETMIGIERTEEDTLRFERDMARIELSKVKAQRDELLAALKLARPYLNGEASLKASAAIAKAEGN